MIVGTYLNFYLIHIAIFYHRATTIFQFGSYLLILDIFNFLGLIRELIGAQLHSLTAMFSTTYHKFETFLERITVRQELMVIGHVHDDKSAEIHWELIKQRNKSQQYREAQLAKKKRK